MSVAIEHRIITWLHRFWVTSADRHRLDDLNSDDAQLPPAREAEAPASAGRNRPTCRPGTVITRPPRSAQSCAPLTEDAPVAQSGTASSPPELPDSLLALQRAADGEHRTLQRLTGVQERTFQRALWFEAAAAAHSAVTQYARRNRLNRREVERQLRRITRHPGP
ncbi:hypothetical protein [Streptomyces sp. NPDC056453]|uniref:hypothetical protein n=1 Tax=unclassified Streptomyces TaxID=2593676 RepID=UPI0036971CF8